MRLRVTYHLACSSRLAAAKARDIAFEQTVELPADAMPPEVALVCGDLPQLLNLLFGNISLKTGILIAGLEWPDELLTALRGPRLGIAGLRELTGARGRPLRCTALKPLGRSAAELAQLAYGFARWGLGLVKDD